MFEGFLSYLQHWELYIINKANKCPAATTRSFEQAFHDVVKFEAEEKEENKPP